MKKLSILLILILCLFQSACQGRNIKLPAIVGDLSVGSFKLNVYLADYKDFFVSEYTEIVDTQNKRVYLQTTLSDGSTKKQVDISLHNGNKVLKVNSVNYAAKSPGNYSLTFEQLVEMLESCYRFKSDKLSSERIVIEVLPAPVEISFTDLKNVYLVEPDGFAIQYKEKTFDGYIVRITSGDELYHLCFEYE